MDYELIFHSTSLSPHKGCKHAPLLKIESCNIRRGVTWRLACKVCGHRKQSCSFLVPGGRVVAHT